MIKKLAPLLATSESAVISVSRTSDTALRVVVNFPGTERPALCLDGTPDELDNVDLTPVADAHRSLADAVKLAAEQTLAKAEEVRKSIAARKKPEAKPAEVKPAAKVTPKDEPKPEPKEEAKPEVKAATPEPADDDETATLRDAIAKAQTELF